MDQSSSSSSPNHRTWNFPPASGTHTPSIPQELLAGSDLFSPVFSSSMAAPTSPLNARTLPWPKAGTKVSEILVKLAEHGTRISEMERFKKAMTVAVEEAVKKMKTGCDEKIRQVEERSQREVEALREAIEELKHGARPGSEDLDSDGDFEMMDAQERRVAASLAATKDNSLHVSALSE
jgi:hypothetical protein